MDLINHGLIVMVTVFLVYHASKEYSVTNVHVILCTLGYILLMSEAILILAGENLLADVLTRRTRSHLHWILQVLGAICTIAGVLVMYRAKTLHFRTHHALTGIASVGIMCFLLAFGYPVLAAAKFRKILKPVLVKFTHNFLGIACFALGIACQCLGYRYRWLSYVTGSLQDIELVCIVLTVIIGVLSLRGALVSLCGQAVQLFR
ncbi:hypothetical protein KM043_008470 [Ampulex compressa]|nr:hypothetical protein KM043_008470 [Ampulex compressa]